MGLPGRYGRPMSDDLAFTEDDLQVIAEVVYNAFLGRYRGLDDDFDIENEADKLSDGVVEELRALNPAPVVPAHSLSGNADGADVSGNADEGQS